MNLKQIAIKKIRRTCDVRSFKVVAMALRNGVPIVVECNRRHDGDGCGPWSFHAEERLYRKLRKRGDFERFPTLDLIVLRIGDGKLRMAKPCNRCMGITWYFDKVYYSNSAGEIVRMR